MHLISINCRPQNHLFSTAHLAAYAHTVPFVGTRRERCRKRCLRISWRWINSGLIIIIAPPPHAAQRNLQCAQSAGNLCVMVWRAEGAFAQHFAWCITKKERGGRSGAAIDGIGARGQLLVPHRPSVSAPFWWPPAASFHLLLLRQRDRHGSSSRARADINHHLICMCAAPKHTPPLNMGECNAIWIWKGLKTEFQLRPIFHKCNKTKKLKKFQKQVLFDLFQAFKFNN